LLQKTNIPELACTSPAAQNDHPDSGIIGSRESAQTEQYTRHTSSRKCVGFPAIQIIHGIERAAEWLYQKSFIFTLIDWLTHYY
jgi:hypothetical protein